MKERTPQEYITIANNMIKYGGSFFRNIGEAIIVADMTNKRKLAKTFAKQFTEYENM